MIEEYRQKLENLPPDRLAKLVELYHKTIAGLEKRQRESRQMAATPIIEYLEQELKRKQMELVLIEQLVENQKSNL